MIIHICPLDKFIPPYIDLINENPMSLEHRFFIISGEDYKYGLNKSPNIEFVDNQSSVIEMLSRMKEAKKIILHGLWFPFVNQLLLENSELLAKCYWVMWGGDFYFPEKQSEITRKIIEKVGYCVTFTKGDYELAREWYGAEGKHISCLSYTSNTFDQVDVNTHSNDCTNIQIGNSADPSNHHLSILKMLYKFRKENIKVFAPLSYGNKAYAANIINIGKKLFEEKFVSLTEHMPIEEYRKYQEGIDIAVFNHNRQQAFGNSVSLLGMGKKLYMRSNVTLWEVFKEQNLQVFDLNKGFTVDRLSHKVAERNSSVISSIYSRKNLIDDWDNIFKI